MGTTIKEITMPANSWCPRDVSIPPALGCPSTIRPGTLILNILVDEVAFRHGTWK
jgi:hypothetical protein